MSIKSILDDACTDLWLPSKDHVDPLPNYYGAARTGILYGTPAFGADHLILDGSDDRVREDTNAAGAFEIGSPFSWLIWINVTTLTGTRVPLERILYDRGWEVYFNGTYLYFVIKSSGGNTYCLGSEASGGSTYDCYVGCWNGSATFTNYKNGADDFAGQAGAASGTMLGDAVPLSMGARPGGTNPTPGKLRSGALFDRVLTLTEVQTLYDSGNGWQGLEDAVSGNRRRRLLLCGGAA